MSEPLTHIDSSGRWLSNGAIGIREAHADDLPAILAIVTNRPAHFVAAAQPLICTAFSEHRTLVCVEKETLLAFLIWSSSRSEIELLWLAVAPGHEHRGMGTALVRAVMETATTQSRVFLRTATTDSTIPGTTFNGTAYSHAIRFFESLNFAQEARVEGYWSPTNHCLIMSQPLTPQNPLQPVLVKLALLIRPLQREVGRAFHLQDAFVGIAFRFNWRDAILFAEYVPGTGSPQAPIERMATKDEYVLGRRLPFVRMILDEDADSAVYRLEIPGHPEVDEELRKRWGADLETAWVFRIRLAADDSPIRREAALYFVTRTPLDLAQQNALRQVESLFSQVLRTALFLGEVSPHSPGELQLQQVAEELARRLPSRFEEYEKDLQKVVSDLSNPTAWFTHQYIQRFSAKVTSSDSSAPVSADEARLCSAIANATKIEIRDRTEGSFQGKAMRFVQITPRSPDGHTHAASYHAVIKDVDRVQAENEQRGYQLAQFYFKDISYALPPATILWPLADPGDRAEQRFAAVIPRVSGLTLAQHVRREWHDFRSATESTGDHFARIFRTLVRFTCDLGQGLARISDELPQQCIYDSHLGDSNEATRRISKTQRALSFYLDGVRQCSRLRFATPQGFCEIVNPLWVLEAAGRSQIAPEADLWLTTTPHKIHHVDFCHGDFHAGNILVRSDGTVTVLDYDYVGRGRKFSDVATLEASFLLCLAETERFREESEWLAVFPPLLSGLADQDALGALPPNVLGNPDAFNAWRVLQPGRIRVAQDRACASYRALLVSALLRLFTSHHGLLDDKRSYHPGLFATAVFYLGSLLKTMIRTDDQEVAPEVNLYRQPFDLFGTTLDFGREYCRQYFAGLAAKAHARDEFNASRLAQEQLAELLKVADGKPAEQAASLSRFGLRLERLAHVGEGDWRDAFGWTGSLATLYATSPSPNNGRVGAEWARRYKHSTDGAKTPRPRVDATVQHALSAEKQCSGAGWSVWGVSHWGKLHLPAERRRNDDAFIATIVPNGVFTAVADGTGDSQDGGRAAEIALSTMLYALNQNVNLTRAAMEASMQIQQDNCNAASDGACCLVGVLATANGDVEVIQAGDTRFIPEEGDPFPPKIIRLDRRVLGGEPLGDIITSGGNLVREVTSESDLAIHTCRGLRKFALVSDGAFISDAPLKDTQEIQTIVKEAADPHEAAQAIRDRALRSFANPRNKNKADNVTVVVAFRT